MERPGGALHRRGGRAARPAHSSAGANEGVDEARRVFCLACPRAYEAICCLRASCSEGAGSLGVSHLTRKEAVRHNFWPPPYYDDASFHLTSLPPARSDHPAPP